MAMQKIPKQDVLAVIEKLGPCQPIDIRKELKQGDSFLIGAMLSEFLAEGTLVLTKVRRGGGPFYYDPAKLQTIDSLSRYLNEKDRRTYVLLKEHLVMREDAQDPLIRVGLQNMPDFSKFLELNGVNYWRYFLVTENDAKKIIKQNGVDTNTSPIEKLDELEEEVAQLEVELEIPVDKKEVEKLAVVEEKKEVVVEKKEEVKEIPKEEVKEEKPKKSKGKKSKTFTKEDFAQHTDSTNETTNDSISENNSVEATVEKPKKKRVSKKKVAPAPTVTSDGSVVIAPEAWLAHDTLYERILKFANGAPIKEQKVIKPNAQISCVMTTELPFGKVDVMIVAFNKKLNDDDLAKAVAAAKDKGLPVLLLSVDPFQSKMTSIFKGFSNVMFKQFEQKAK